MNRRILGWGLVVALLVCALAAPSAGAKVRYPRLDSSFGSGGYVALPGELPGPSGEPMRLEHLASTRGGAVYATESSLVGSQCLEKCLYRGFLARVNSDGSVATTFGGGGRVEVANGVEEVSSAIADLEGRALVATLGGSTATVRRYLPDGSADTSFGGDGAVSFDCGCGNASIREVQLAVDGRDRVVVLIDTPSGYDKIPVSSTLVRLLPGGAMDRGFGSGGTLQLGSQPESLGIAFGANDAVYMWGISCCERSSKPFLHRVSAKGRVDSKFDARADRTLANVGARRALNYESAVLVVRPNGLLDLYGGDGLLRLRTNGNAEAKFGDSGVQLLGWSVIAAALVGHGRVLGLGQTSEGISLIRLKPNGHADRSFGSEGARLIEGVYEGEGLSLAWLNGRRAQVLDLGSSFCRSSCAANPSLVRYRIGPKQH